MLDFVATFLKKEIRKLPLSYKTLIVKKLSGFSFLLDFDLFINYFPGCSYLFQKRNEVHDMSCVQVYLQVATL